MVLEIILHTYCAVVDLWVKAKSHGRSMHNAEESQAR